MAVVTHIAFLVAMLLAGLCAVQAAPPAPLVIADFGEPGVLDRVSAGPGVAAVLAEGTGAHRVLEVRVAPFATHRNEWPSVVLGPAFFTQPVDLSGHSRVVVAVSNLTQAPAQVHITLSSLPYNDGGRNLEGRYCSVSGGATRVCEVPTRVFELNDPSAIRLMYFTFPPTETAAVYHIDTVRAVFVPAEGSLAGTLQHRVAVLDRQFGAIKRRLARRPAGSEPREMADSVPELDRRIRRLREGCAQIGTPAFTGRYRPLSEELEGLSRAVGRLLLAGERGFAAWRIDPYINVLRDEAPTPGNEGLPRLDACLAQGEARDKVFMVSACEGDVRLTVRVAPSGGLPAEGIQVLETRYLPTRRPGQETGDVVHPLRGPLLIPKGESRQVRLRFDAREGRVKPGRHRFTLALDDAESGERRQIPGSVEVWGFRLPGYELPNNCYAELDSSEFVQGDLTALAVRDMKACGLNVVYLHPREMPRPTGVDGEGNLTGLDTAVFERRVVSALEAWQAAPGEGTLRFVFSLSDMYELGLKRDDIRFPKAKWRRVFAQWLTQFRGVVRRLGIRDEDWLLALGDEASERALVDREIPMAEAIKAISPDTRIVCNTSTVLSDGEMSRRFFRVFDVLQPHLPALKADPKLLAWVRSSGKTLWTYKCLCDLGTRGKNTYEYYRVYAWDLLKYGLAGTGVWTYCAGAEAQRHFGCILVHRDGDELVHSRRYEVFREGLDDYRYVRALREAAGARGPEASRRAEALIRDAVADITSHPEDTTRCEVWRIRLAKEILRLARAR